MSGFFFRIVARLWTSGKLYIEMRIYFRTRSLCVCVWRGENQSLASRFKLSASDNHLVPARFILPLCCCAVVVKPTYIYFLILLRCNRCAWWIVGHQTIQMYTTIVCTICLIAGLILYPFFLFICCCCWSIRWTIERGENKDWQIIAWICRLLLAV